MKIKQRRKYDDMLPGQWWEVDQNRVSYLQEKKKNKAGKKSKTENLAQTYISELYKEFLYQGMEFHLADFT